MLEETTLPPDGTEDLVKNEQLIAANQEVLKQTNPQEIIDEQGFGRTEFSFPQAEGVTLVFRGREELPTLAGEQTTSHSIVPEEAPWRTSQTEYQGWLGTTSGSTPFRDPFERAIEQGHERVRLIATSTPYGIVSTALRLAEAGVTQPDPEQLLKLQDLQSQLRNGEESPEVDKLYDQIFAASALKIGEESLDRVAEHEGNDQALMEVVLALSGDEAAQTIVQAKLQEVERRDQQRHQHDYQERYNYPEGIQYKPPGEKLTEEELKLVEQEHLIAVHTTPTMPQLDESTGTRRLFPTASYGEAGDKIPRNTLHFSLNHPVESHIEGNFNNRPYTVITPMAETLEANGRPTVLNGVDTFFTLDPKSGLELPQGSIILEVSHEDDTPGIELNGDTLVLKGEHLTSSDMHEQLAFITHRYVDQLLPPNGPRDQAEVMRAVSQMLLQSTNSLRSVLPQDIEHDILPEYFIKQMDAMKKLLADTLSQNGGESVGVDSLNGDQKLEVLQKAIQRLYTEDGLIEQYPELSGLLTEAMRQTLVKLEIAHMGGEVVDSDNQSGYVETKGFDERVVALGKQLGVKLELHNYTTEKFFEDQYIEAVNKSAVYGEPVEREPGNPSAGYDRGEPIGFNWEEFQRRTKNMTNILLNLPPLTRRMAVSMGLLSYAKLPTPKQTGPRIPGA